MMFDHCFICIHSSILKSFSLSLSLNAVIIDIILGKKHRATMVLPIGFEIGNTVSHAARYPFRVEIECDKIESP